MSCRTTLSTLSYLGLNGLDFDVLVADTESKERDMTLEDKFQVMAIRYFDLANQHCVDEFGDPDYDQISIVEADWEDGSELTQEELDYLNYEAEDLWFELVNARLYGKY